MHSPTNAGDNPYRFVLRRAVVPSAVAGVLTAVVFWVLQGTAAGLSGLFGVAIALAFFVSGMVMMARFVRDTANPMLFMAVGMATYFAQVIVMLGILVLVSGFDGFDTLPAGIAMLVAVLVWQVAQVVAWRRARVPIYDTMSETTTESSR